MKKTLLLLFIANITLTHFSQTYDWSASFGAFNIDVARKIETDSKGNTYLFGEFNGTIDFNPGPGVNNLTSAGPDISMFLVKLDSNKNFIWGKKIKDNSSVFPKAGDITIDNNDNVFISAQFNQSISVPLITGIDTLVAQGNNPDIFLLKINPMGNFIWIKSISGAGGQELLTNLKTDKNSNLYISGTYRDTLFVDNSSRANFLLAEDTYNGFLLKLSSEGDFVWANNVSSSKNLRLSIIGSENNNIYLIGFFENILKVYYNSSLDTLSSMGSKDIFISKIDTNGNLIWNKTIGGGSNDFANMASAIDGNANIYISGEFSGVVDFDPNIGITNLTSVSAINSFALKMDNSGNYIFAKQWDARFDINALVIDKDNKLILGGNFTQPIDFDLGLNTNRLTPNRSSIPLRNSVTGYVLRLNQNGELEFAKKLNGTSNTILLDVSTSHNSFYFCGYYDGTCELDLNSTTNTTTSQGSFDVFIVKMSLSPSNTSSLENHTSATNLTAFPNPTNGNITIDGIRLTETNYAIFNPEGKQLQVNRNGNTLNTEKLLRGMYVIRVMDNGTAKHVKFIKQ